jgi:hypothetical protein
MRTGSLRRTSVGNKDFVDVTGAGKMREQVKCSKCIQVNVCIMPLSAELETQVLVDERLSLLLMGLRTKCRVVQ